MPKIWTEQRKFSQEPVFAGTDNCCQGEQVRIEVSNLRRDATVDRISPKISRAVPRYHGRSSVARGEWRSRHCRMEAGRHANSSSRLGQLPISVLLYGTTQARRAHGKIVQRSDSTTLHLGGPAWFHCSRSGSNTERLIVRIRTKYESWRGLIHECEQHQQCFGINRSA